MRILALAGMATLALAASATPAAAEWRLIGQREVQDRMDRDTIVVEGHQQYERLRICVYRNPVHFVDMDIAYHNGGHQDVPLAFQINAGDCSRVIDLVGDERDIATITLVYEENGRGRGHAHIRIFAE